VFAWLLALLLLLAPQSTVDPLRIAVVGDSISCSPINPAWCPELSRLLTAAGVDHVLLPLAVGGTRCASWAGLIGDVLDEHQVDIVILGCGTNDGADQRTAAEVQAAVESVAAQAHAAGARLLVGVPSYSSGQPTGRPWLSAAQHEAYAGITAAWATFAAAYGPDFSPAVFDDTRLPSLMRFKVGDGVHSTPAGDLVYAHNRYRALQAFIPGMPNIAPDCMQIGHPPGEPIPRGIPCYGRPGV
jgi:lysophospholipase L1-like esterase